MNQKTPTWDSLTNQQGVAEFFWTQPDWNALTLVEDYAADVARTGDPFEVDYEDAFYAMTEYLDRETYFLPADWRTYAAGDLAEAIREYYES